MRTSLKYAVALALVVSLRPEAMQAQAAGVFDGAGYSDFNSSNGFGNGWIWHTGDYWQQVTGPTGLSSVTSLALALGFDNVLSAGYSQVFSVLINGFGVGSFTVNSGDLTFGGAYSFAGLAGFGAGGDEYEIRLQQSSADIPGGEGSTRLQHSSTYALDGTAVPEPGTLTLLATGLLGIVGALKRRRNRAGR